MKSINFRKIIAQMMTTLIYLCQNILNKSTKYNKSLNYLLCKHFVVVAEIKIPLKPMKKIQ